MIDPTIPLYIKRFKGVWELKPPRKCDACYGVPYETWEVTDHPPWLCAEHARELNLLW